MAEVHAHQMQIFIALLESTKTIDRRIWMFNRDSKLWENDVPKMDEKTFKYNIRVSKHSFQKICSKADAMARKDTNMRSSIPLDKRVGVALYAFGSSAEYRTIAHLFGIGHTTVGEIVLEFCVVICENFGAYISSYPPTPQEIKRITDGFQELGFPQCYGAVDGCHIEIQPEKEEAVDYYNFKGWYSVILMAACDHSSKFTYFNVGSAGKNNDSYIFKQSALKRCHENCELFARKLQQMNNINIPVLLIGDSAFRLSRYLMKPYPFHINQPIIEKTFNYRLNKCRRVIENAFGQLKARFRKVGRGLEVAPRNCNVIIKACCLLHNFLKEEEDEVPQFWLEEATTLTQRIQPNPTTSVGNNNVDRKAIRNAIAESFMCSLTEDNYTE